MNQEMTQVLNQVSRPDFSALFSRIFAGGEKFFLDNSTLAMHVIMAECDGFMSQRLLPEKAASLTLAIDLHQQAEESAGQFSYTDEDGAAHTTRRIDWDYIFS